MGRRKKLSKGPCENCGLRDHLPCSSLCQKCKTENIRNFRKNRLSQGLCAECGKYPHLQKRVRCQVCADRLKQKDAIRRAEWIAKGVCKKRGCNNPIEDNVLCNDCREKQNSYVRRRRKRLKNEGLCESCGQNTATGNHLCETCWLKKVADRHLGNKDKWVLLKEKFELQNESCPYTGIKLVIGENASIDHIVPKSLGGAKTLDNIQWVHIWINLMKFNLKHEDFVVKFREFIQLVKEFESD